MDLFNSVAQGVITLAAVLAAIGVLLKYAKGPVLEWLGVTTTPTDVKALLEEVDAKVDRLLEASAPPSAEEIAEAMDTMRRAGITVNDDTEEHDDI